MRGAFHYLRSCMASGARPVEALDYKQVRTMLLNIGQRGEITLPDGLLRELALAQGGKVAAVRMGQLLLLAPHDEELESLSLRLQKGMKDAGISVQQLKDHALAARAEIFRERYASPSRRTTKRRK